MPSFMKRALFVVLVLLGVSSLGATEHLTVKVRPSVCFAPCTVKVEIRHERAANNAMLALLLEGHSNTQYSEIPLSENSPAVITRDYRDLPAAEYDIVVALIKHDGRDWMAGKTTTHFIVRSEEH